MTAQINFDAEAAGALKAIVGEENFISDTDEIAYYSQDVYRTFEQALAVIRPGTVEELSRIVTLANKLGLAIVTRGGGMSYTDGYLHATDHGITIDTRRLNQIVELSTEDMYVTVESGCTWESLNAALTEHKLRTPYWGPLSGTKATIGGALSQNSVFWGGTSDGPVSDSVIGMDIVLADGTLLSTGAHAREGGLPFMRYDGPDLTGLFIGDTGALGIKATATFRLLPVPEEVSYASYSFETHEQVCAAMSEIARQRLASEIYTFDPYYSNSKVLDGDSDLVEDVKTLAKVAEKSGIKESVKVAVAGRRFAKKVKWGMHLHVEDRYADVVQRKLQTIKSIADEHAGWEIPNSLPKIVGAYPFPPTNSMVGPLGQRWVPIHGKVAHSQAADTISKIQDWHAKNAESMKKYQIDTAFLLCTVGAGAFLIEPVYLWPDELEEMHRRNVEASVLEGFEKKPANHEARNEVERLRQGIRKIFLQQGAIHFQIGKYYPYRESRKEVSWQMLEKIKTLVDEKNLMNPGQLGLDYEK